MVYLDHAATTPLSDAAREAMEPLLGDRFGNASEPHALGRAASAALGEARRTVAERTGCEPGQVIFTSGGTEADNQAVFGLAGDEPGRIVVSAVEHAAVREPALRLERRGFEVAWASVDRRGVLDIDEFRALVHAGDRLAAVMWANNVTGAIQPIPEVAAICADAGVPLHVDAVQAAPSLALGFATGGAATMAVSAHKLHGPKGVGCLLARDPAGIPPLIWGGGQEAGRRSGTENVAGAAGFAAALAEAPPSDDPRRMLRDRLESGLPEGVTVVSADAERLPGHSLLLVAGLRAELLALALDRAGFAVAAGSACESEDQEPSHVLTAQGMAVADARSVIRVSLGSGSTADEVDGFLAAFSAALLGLRAGALTI